MKEYKMLIDRKVGDDWGSGSLVARAKGNCLNLQRRNYERVD